MQTYETSTSLTVPAHSTVTQSKNVRGIIQAVQQLYINQGLTVISNHMSEKSCRHVVADTAEEDEEEWNPFQVLEQRMAQTVFHSSM